MFYVYRFLDEKENIIYVGRTNDLKGRMRTHFGSSGHLSLDCYDSVQVVEYATFKARIEMNIYELYLINLYKPVFNVVSKYDDELSIELPIPKWKKYRKDEMTYEIEPDHASQRMRDMLHLAESARPKEPIFKFVKTESIQEDGFDRHIQSKIVDENPEAENPTLSGFNEIERVLSNLRETELLIKDLLYMDQMKELKSTISNIKMNIISNRNKSGLRMS